MNLPSSKRSELPSDIIYSQEPLWHYTQEPQQPQVLQEEDSWEFAANKKNEKDSTQVEIDMESGNGSLVSDAVIDSESDTTNNADSDSANDSDSDSASIPTSSPHLQTGSTVSRTASTAASAANRMVATVPVNAPAGQPQHDFSANNRLIGKVAVVALVSVISSVMCTLGVMDKFPNNSGKPISEEALYPLMMGGVFSGGMALFSTAYLMNLIVCRLRKNS